MSDSEQPTENEVYAQAVSLLSRRDHSARELAAKLATREAPPAHIEAVLQRLADARFLNDERFAENYIRQRSAKGYGERRIRAELRERGVDDSIVNRQLRQAEEQGEVDWFELAQTAYRKKFGDRTIEDLKERAKRMRFMQYRGFSHEQIDVAMQSE